MMTFQDRTEAGERLAESLAKYKGEDSVVFALPRGGAPVAAAIARALNAPLDLVLVRKIGAPFQPELAMGAVADGGHEIVVRNEDVIAAAQVREAEFEDARRREVDELSRRRRLYLGDRPRAETIGRVAIVVDDGIATGATMRAALRAVRARQPSKLVLATPVAPVSTLQDLAAEVDEVVCLEAQDDFGAIGQFYKDFRQLADEEVIAILDELGPRSA
jgi:predicted phosphoribosyltransferase